MARSTNTGSCQLCDFTGAESEMARHLEKCAPAHDLADSPQELVALRIKAAGDPRYWIQVEVRADATLDELDTFLRYLWLECCDHMSIFHVGNTGVHMAATIAAVFHRKGTKFRHDYDFGSTTTLNGQVVGVRQGSIGRSSIRLLARNDPLDWPCAECKGPATTLCLDCIGSDACLFCDAHAGEHEHAEEEVGVPVVNSPRMGVCGYTG